MASQNLVNTWLPAPLSRKTGQLGKSLGKFYFHVSSQSSQSERGPYILCRYFRKPFPLLPQDADRWRHTPFITVGTWWDVMGHPERAPSVPSRHPVSLLYNWGERNLNGSLPLDRATVQNQWLSLHRYHPHDKESITIEVAVWLKQNKTQQNDNSTCSRHS